MSDWQNLDKIFIGNAKGIDTVNYGTVDKEWIIENNPPYIERGVVKPVSFIDGGAALVWQLVIRYYRDGRIERKYEYNSIEPRIDGVPAISTLGYRIIMQAFDKNNRVEGEQNDRCNCISDEPKHN